MKTSLLRAVALLGASAMLVPAVFAGGPAEEASSFQTVDPAVMGDLFKINTDLAADSPCAEAGGEWRGWCMDMDGNVTTIGVSRVGATRISPRQTRAIELECRDVADRTLRRECYRIQRESLYGIRPASSRQLPFLEMRNGRNIYYYITN